MKEFFQDFMPENVCFGCGASNTEGLQIKSYWENDTSICIWEPKEKYHGWANLLNGGIIATLIDCHCMGTAMAYAYKIENRSLNSEPIYRYATGTLNIKYLKPTPNNYPVVLKAKIIEVKNRKTIINCSLYTQDIKTVEAEVIAIRVYDSSLENKDNLFK